MDDADLRTVKALSALLAASADGSSSMEQLALRLMADTQSPLHSHDAMALATTIENAAGLTASALCNLSPTGEEAL